ncbi:MAG: hypothetical protein AB1583_10100 [Bacteroidota bacterium]|nr:hypothetical protein [Bacteroidales bacterium]
MRQLAFIFILLLNGLWLPAQDYNELRIRLKKSYAAGRMNDWEPLMRQLEKNFLSSEDTKWLEELAWAEYGYAAYLLHTKQEEKANKVISSALGHADRLLKLNPRKGCYLALKSSLTAFRIQLRPISAPILGPRSVRLLEKAYEIDPNNYRVLTEKGLARLYAPSWAGGNPEEAVVFFSKAAAAIAKNPESVNNDWYYLHLMASYGQSLQKTGRNVQAIEIYRKVLNVEPSFQWVKNELLPRALSEAKN